MALYLHKKGAIGAAQKRCIADSIQYAQFTDARREAGEINSQLPGCLWLVN